MSTFTPQDVRELRRKLGVNTAAQRAAGTFSPATHVHDPADVTGLVADLANTPRLDADNVFTGSVQEVEALHANIGLTTDGYVTVEEATIRATNVTGLRDIELPDASGNLLVDAPSDGKYYVRKDGAWVEIVP